MNTMKAAVLACGFWSCASPVTAQNSDRLKSEIARGDRFHLTVDYSRTLDEMIKAGKYAYVNEGIVAKNFPIDGKGTVEIELVLIQIFGNGRSNHMIRAEDALHTIKSHGLEPAKIEHCLALGETYPEFERKVPILFLGRRYGDFRGVPSLNVGDAGRELRLLATRTCPTHPYTYLYFAGVRQVARSETFPVKVDYAKTLTEMIEAGKYKSSIPAEDLPHKINGKDVVDVEIVLLHFDRDISSAEVNKEIKARGLEPAKIEHLLAFGARHPEVQRKFEIVFLGASWIAEDGRVRIIPLLTQTDGDRMIVFLSERGGGTFPGSNEYRFAAVRPKKK